MPELAASHIKMIFQPEAKAQLLLLCVQPNCWKKWCPGAESNHRHRDFQSRALPTELPGRRPGARLRSEAPPYRDKAGHCPAAAPCGMSYKSFEALVPFSPPPR